jgi:hypothetical protein
MPAINGLELEKYNKTEVKPSNSDFDMLVEFKSCEYKRHNLLNTKSFYDISWRVAHSGEIEGWIDVSIKLGDKEYDRFEVWLPWDPNGWSESGVYELELENNDIPKYDEELYFAGSEIALEIDINDDNPDNNVDHQLAKFWQDDDKYKPAFTHLIKALPIWKWIQNETFEFEDGTIVNITRLRSIYKGIILPVFLSSNRLGWFGDFLQLFIIDFGKNLTAFLYEFIQVAGLIAAGLLELYGIVMTIIGLFSSVAAGQVAITKELVEALFGQLSLLILTIGALIVNLDDLPVDPEDPLRENLSKSVDAVWEFLYTRPWLNDITIKGSVDRCKRNEKVTLNCRNVKNMEIPGDRGKRTIEPFTVNSSFNRDAYKDGLLFRRCQVTIEGDKHIGQLYESPKLLSYCAPEGTLKIISGFSKSCSRDRSILLNRLIDPFPMLVRLIQLLYPQPIMN